MMRADVTRDRRWSDLLIPDACKILGPFVLMPASWKQDCQEATDIVLTTGKLSIAYRMRGGESYIKWPDDFTIRTARISGAKTELAKILEGHCDWMFYGFSEDKAVITHWRIVDLQVFRRVHPTGQFISEQIRNCDFASEGRAFHIPSFPRDILIGSSEPILFRRVNWAKPQRA